LVVYSSCFGNLDLIFLKIPISLDYVSFPLVLKSELTCQLLVVERTCCILITITISGEVNVGAMVSPDSPKKKYAQKKSLVYIKDEAE